MKYLHNDPLLKSKRRHLRKNQTSAEWKLWQALRNKQLDNLKFYRQYSVGPFILDFFCPKFRLAIEIDGGQHGETIQKQYDQKRTDYLEKRHINVLRFQNDDVSKNVEGVWEKIKETVESVTPPASPN